MTTSTLPSALGLLLIALIGPGFVQPDLARADHIGCGSTLGPGGKHVLDRDLTCSTAEDGPHWGLFVADGATLNMNGHTVTCANSGRGILVIDAKLKNGTVRGCDEGVAANRSVVKRMTLDGNAVGISLTEGKRANLIIGNTAMNGGIGFLLEENGIGNNSLIDNVARGNGYGFYVEGSWYDTFIGNRAVGNHAGFVTSRTGLFGNVAKKNRLYGFDIGSATEMTGNVAKKNHEDGFVVGTALGLGDDALDFSNNVADGNGRDGFAIRVGPAHPVPFPRTVTSNHAIANRGTGFHVLRHHDDEDQKSLLIRGNTSLGNQASDMADDNDCLRTIWENNAFDTASETCIQ